MRDGNGQSGGPDAGADELTSYDALGRVTSQTDPGGNQTTLSYSDSSGMLMDPTDGNGVVTLTDPQGYQSIYDFQNGALHGHQSFRWAAQSGISKPRTRR